MKHKGKTIIVIAVVAILFLIFFTDFSIPGVLGDTDTGMEIIIHYTDGSHEVFGPQPTYGIMPFTILVQGQPIDYIEYSVMAKLTWEGDFQWLKTSTNVEIYLQDGTWFLPLWNKQGSTEDSYGDTISGEWFSTYGPEIITADALNFVLVDQHKHGVPVALTFKPVVTATMLMNDQTTAEREGSAQAAVTILLEEQAKSVSALDVQMWSTPF